MIFMTIINYIIRSKVIEDIQVHLEMKSCQKSKSKMHWDSPEKIIYLHENFKHSTWKKFCWWIKITPVNTLKKLRYVYNAPKLKVKRIEPQKEARYNWCLCHFNWTYPTEFSLSNCFSPAKFWKCINRQKFNSKFSSIYHWN